MKIRTDFVTNSSSSSFVLARKAECTLDEIRDTLHKLESQMNALFEQLRKYHYSEAEGLDINLFIEELANKLFDFPMYMQLGEWSASAAEYNNEGSIDEMFMYEYGHMIQSENFKVGGRYE